MANIHNILATAKLFDLTWSGNDKKTANVDAGTRFAFHSGNLPDFSEIYNKPGQFKITYRDENGIDRIVTCNYVSNGQSRYTFSYKLDNDVINLSVFKSDGHLEINVRNAKLEYPMDLNTVEFYIDSLFNVSYAVDGPGRVIGEETALANSPQTIEVIPNEGCRLIDISVGDGEVEYELRKIDDTHYRYIAPKEVFYDDIFVVANFEEIPPVEEYPINIYSYEHCNPAVEPNTYIQGETTFTITVNPEEGYELDYILIQNLDGTSDYYQGTELTHLAEWSGEPDPLMPENPWGYRIAVVCKEIPVPPTPTDYDLIFTTTFNRYAIVDTYVKSDGSAAKVEVRSMEKSIDIDDTFEDVLRSTCTFRQDLIVDVEVEMNKPDYTVKSTKVKINGKEIN